MTLILIAEDDELQAELVRRYLVREGHDTELVTGGAAALDRVRAGGIDLLVLDVMLPEMDGYTVSRRLRDSGDATPILMLTARGDEDDMLVGLELGADDYLAKPYSPRELVARVAALLRRTRGVSESVLRVGPLVLDIARHEASVDGAPVALTVGEFQLLVVMAENVGIVLSRAQLLGELHGTDRFLTARTIDTHVKNIRVKLERDPRDPQLLRTVFGVGYKLTPPDAG